MNKETNRMPRSVGITPNASATGGTLGPRSGHKVTVLEARPTVGGRALVVHQGGFTLNYGYHFLLGGYQSPHWRVLKRLGHPVQHRPTWPAGFGQQREDGLFNFPILPPSVFRYFGIGGAFRYLKHGRQMTGTDPDSAMNVPLGEFLANSGATGRIRSWHLAMARAVGFTDRPEMLSAGHYIAFSRIALQNWRNPSLIMAWDRMFEGLRSVIERAGGQILLKAEVSAISVESGRVQGVWSDGELLSDRTAILAVPPQALSPLIQPLEPHLARRALELEPTAEQVAELAAKQELYWPA